MALEKTITNAIIKAARADGWWVLKVAGGPYQTAGIPDLLCVKDGRAAFVEVKQPGKAPTAIQLHRMNEIKKTGGAVAAVATSVAEAMEILRTSAEEG
jgi:Holliday junction resolvase